MFLKKHRFFVLKKRYLIFAVCFLLVVTSAVVYFTAIKPAVMPKPSHSIVIDAGHGGVDGGASGKITGASESSLNLDYALTLKKICEDYGVGVTLTRKDMNGLYSLSAANKKRSEMEKRQQIIKNSEADLVVSIHMNSFPLSEARGAQVYYAAGAENGERLAESVQNSLSARIDYAKKTAKVGDFYILNCSSKPSILVECGFLSNPEEEQLLVQEEYRNNFCYNLFCGIMSYFDF